MRARRERSHRRDGPLEGRGDPVVTRIGRREDRCGPDRSGAVGGTVRWERRKNTWYLFSMSIENHSDVGKLILVSIIIYEIYTTWIINASDYFLDICQSRLDGRPWFLQTVRLWAFMPGVTPMQGARGTSWKEKLGDWLARQYPVRAQVFSGRHPMLHGGFRV